MNEVSDTTKDSDHVPKLLIRHAANPDYNIKIQYPSNWTKQETNLSPSSPVFFHTPTQYSFETPNASLNIFVFVSQPNSTVDAYAASIKSGDNDKIKSGEIRLINSSFTTLARLRGWVNQSCAI